MQQRFNQLYYHMGFFDCIFGRQTARSTDVEFEIFKALGKDEYQKYRKEKDVEAQKIDDSIYENRLTMEAYDEFHEWMHSQSMFHDPVRRIAVWEVHDLDSSRFKEPGSDKAFKDALFKKLKEEAITKAKYPEWIDKEIEQDKTKWGEFYCIEFTLWMNPHCAFLDGAEKALVSNKYKTNN